MMGRSEAKMRKETGAREHPDIVTQRKNKSAEQKRERESEKKVIQWGQTFFDFTIDFVAIFRFIILLFTVY